MTSIGILYRYRYYSESYRGKVIITTVICIWKKNKKIIIAEYIFNSKMAYKIGV